MIPTLYVMIGPAGSGKTTFANGIRGADVISTDQLRKEMFGDEAVQGQAARVFRAAYHLTRMWLNMGLNVVFDATNTTTKTREELLKNVRGIDCHKVAIYMNTPRGECKFRNNKRERKVLNEVINRQDWQMERDAQTIPEQFDEIIVVNGWKEKK